VIYLLDAGCGRSYLTLLTAWCAKHVWSHPLEVLGIDRNPAVIEASRRRCALAQLDDAVRFEVTLIRAIKRSAGDTGSSHGSWHNGDLERVVLTVTA
jgi:predicted RNA methylase